MTNTLFSITNAKGRQVNLLNDDCFQEKSNKKKKYHCSVAGCNKSFTTSGHLARHNRIHTGEKNFHCLYPGCPSRFSRQDNMMQHYRTHLSSRSRLHYYYNYNYYHQTPSPYHRPQLEYHYYNHEKNSILMRNNRRELSTFSDNSSTSSGSSTSPSPSEYNYQPSPQTTNKTILPPLQTKINWVYQQHDDMKSKGFFFEGYA